MANYYVSLSGDNGNAGTEASPWRTVAYGISQCSSGDTLWVVATEDSYNYGSDIAQTIPAGVIVRGKGEVFPYFTPSNGSIIRGTIINLHIKYPDARSSGAGTGKIYNCIIEHVSHDTASSEGTWIFGAISVYNSIIIGKTLQTIRAYAAFSDSGNSYAYNTIFMSASGSAKNMTLGLSQYLSGYLYTYNCNRFTNVTSSGRVINSGLINEDTELGELYTLPAGSACIDGGYGTGAPWDDVDSGDGTPRPPAQGTLQNDIGLWGGAYAMELLSLVPPVGANDTINNSENETYTFAEDDFTFTSANIFAGIQVITVETAGTLLYNGLDVSAGDTCSDVTKLTYIQPEYAWDSPYATFTFKVRDNYGQVSENAYTMTINVLQMNYFVSVDGSDSGEGRNDDPFKTVDKAISSLVRTGSTIWVKGDDEYDVSDLTIESGDTIKGWDDTPTLSPTGNATIYGILQDIIITAGGSLELVSLTTPLRITTGLNQYPSLPGGVIGTYSNGAIKEFPVTWDDSSLDLTTAGTYSLTATVEGLTVTQTVVVLSQWQETQKKPSAWQTVIRPSVEWSNR